MSKLPPPSSFHPRFHRGDSVTASILILLGGYLTTVTFCLAGMLWTAELSPERREAVNFDLIAHGVAAITCFVAWKACLAAGSSLRRARIVTLTAVLVVLVSSDRLIGIAYPMPPAWESILQRHDQRGWTHLPLAHEAPGDTHAGSSEVQIDRYGLRVAPGHELRDVAKTRSILFVGDSVTFGFGVQAEDTFPVRTIAALRVRHPKLDIVALNAGVMAYDTKQEYGLLVESGFPLEPKFLIHQICLNDITEQFEPNEGLDEMLGILPKRSWSGWIRAAMAWKVSRENRFELQQEGKRIERFQLSELFREDQTDRDRFAWSRMEEYLEKISVACRERRVPFAMVCFPIRDQIANVHGDSPQKRLSAFAKKKGIAFLDLLPVFKAAGQPGEALAAELFIDSTHPRPRGQQLAGVAAAEFLCREFASAAIFKD